MTVRSLRVHQDHRYVVGLDLGGTSLKAGLVAQNGKVIRHRDEALTDRSPRAVLGMMRTVIQSLRAQAGDPKRVLGAGLLVPAPVDAAKGVVIKAANLGPAWSNVNVARFFRGQGELPVTVENDANGFAFGTWYYDFKRKPDHLVGITLGTGVGGGIILNRKVWYGDTGVAGEIGHVRVRHEHGTACGCGSSGCIEQYASASAIPRIAMQLAPHFHRSRLARLASPSGEVVAQYAARGDRLAKATFAHIGVDLGRVVSSMVNAFGVLNYSFGGKGARSFDYFGPSLLEEVRTHCNYLGHAIDGLTIRPTTLGDHAAVIGAASLVFDKRLH